MDTKKVLSWIALIGGEAIIIAAFLIFRGNLAENILVLNMIISSLIYGLIFFDILMPWIDLNDKSQKKVASLGMRWIFTGLYMVTSIGVMLLGNLIYEWTFGWQLIAQCVLIFLLILAFVAILSASDKVSEVYEQEKLNRDGINEMKTAMINLKNKMNETTDLPINFINRIDTIEENLRYISPSNSKETYPLEKKFSQTVNEISFAISNYSMNEESIENKLKTIERLYQNRKSVYSN